jgi:hypothetical protein
VHVLEMIGYCRHEPGSQHLPRGFQFGCRRWAISSVFLATATQTASSIRY